SLTGGEPAAKTLRARESILSELAVFSSEFQRLVMRSHDREALLRPAADGGWGVVEILPHLRDWDEVYADRIAAIVEIDVPRLTSFDDSLWSIERDYRGQDPVETLEDLTEIRGKTVELLSQLPADAWEREAIFETEALLELWQSEGVPASDRRITLHWLCDQMCDHDREHLNQALDAVAS
ncbi:MAG: DinB family protein, partial [Thermomicrobiales bacterium]